ncbi:MAG: proteasome accessory factor PafA2 family protein [Armatimonadetes bacterium]|nr:proteasome accessory factor PafA2 family protein [Armatimonadota bacterium]
MRMMGLETEYGIAVEGCPVEELLDAGMEIVRAYPGPHVALWDYGPESPRRDLRGFTAPMLAQDPEDARYDRADRPRTPVEVERSDRVLANGARFYNDHGHPEYATPECRTVDDLVAHDRAGEGVVLAAAEAYESATGKHVRVYRNNTDFHGATYGCHESYLTRRCVPLAALVEGLTPFLVTRQAFCGAGKAGIEDGGAARPGFQMSQRADFVVVPLSVDTLYNRPLFNTRDEPHAPAAELVRLHVILGDANMSEWATAMKAGTTSLALELVEQGWRPPVAPPDPVAAVKAVSREIGLGPLGALSATGRWSAVDVQRSYLDAAARAFGGRDAGTDRVLREWTDVLDDLRADPESAFDRVDWVAKRSLLRQFADEEGLDSVDPAMQSLDLAYHDLHPEHGLQVGLRQAGAVCQWVTEEAVTQALAAPPADTRAAIRGHFVRRHPAELLSVCWSGLEVGYRGGRERIDLGRLAQADLTRWRERLARAVDLDETMTIMSQLEGR